MQTSPTLRDWLGEAPFGLAMSAGFFGFFAHAGALVALEEADVRPSRLSGASAGALVTGAWAAGLAPDALARELHALRRNDFWDPAPGLGLLRGRLFLERLRALLPARTFDACRAPLAVSAFDLLSRRVHALGGGDLARAIVASCAVPGLFHPVWIDRRPMVDGGVEDRAGLAGMPHGTRVLFHHLASRSPWRRRGSTALRVPARPDLCAVVAEDLPRVGPFRLEHGPRAFDAGRRAMKEALGRPVGAVIAVAV
jgi:NTE family protein